jgi:hypothetical protein
MDRAQPGARGSTNRNIEFGETTGQYTDGWVVPADEPTLSSQRYTSLDETTFNEFDASYAVDSLTVTIDPGEAFVDGWVARDESTDIDLDADTAGQVVVLGWDPNAIYDDQQHNTRDEADRVIVALEGDVDSTHPNVAIWSFDIDANGVTNAEDHRDIGPKLSENLVDGRTIDYRDVVVDNPDRLPIAELEDGDSIELAIPVDDGEMLEVYRWGGFDVSDGLAPSGLDVELLDGDDTVRVSSNTSNEQDNRTPLASYENSSGSRSIFKLRAINTTGSVIDNPGVSAHFGYVVV